MTEYDLFAAIGDIDERFIRLADGSAARDGEEIQKADGAAVEKKSLWFTIRERINVKTMAGVFAAVICLAFCGTLVYQALRKPPKAPTEDSEVVNILLTPTVTVSPTPGSGTGTPVDPPIVDGVVGIPYAILADLKPTGESRQLEYGVDYVRVECTERYAYQTQYGKITAIYVPADLVAEISGYEMVMIRVESTELDNERIYVPGTTVRGSAEYLPFVDGKIRIDTLDSYSFGAIRDMNDYLQTSADTLARGGEVRANDKYLPEEKLTDGRALQEVIDYFKAYERWSNELRYDRYRPE